MLTAVFALDLTPQNKPILMRELAVKQLIIDGYRKNKLIYIIPFVAKVLEAVANSKVFSPPNPWTMAILKVLKVHLPCMS